jgi:putative nucleotidyltransferase with HDIG domain
MSLEPNLEEQQLLADTLKRAGSSMTSRVRLIEVSVAVGFSAAVAWLWVSYPPRPFAALPAAACLVVLALATRVRFDMPFGFTVPTQLAFVPLLFAMPPALVPVGVVVALLISSLPDVVRGRCKPSRLLLMVGNSWFAIGPAAVFAISGTAPRQAGVGLLLVALAAQFIADFAASTLRFAVGRGAGLAEQLGESWVYAIDAGLSGIGLVIAEEIHTNPVAVLAPLPLLGIFAVLARERHQRLEALLELNNAYRGTALVLGDVVEADDGYTGMHCKSVVALALSVGEELRLGAERRRNLEFAALLHDIGKIAIPKEIINKPGKLDPDEWMLVKTHTVEGQRMLDRVGGFMRQVGLIVRSHHERWDGGGYPDRLAGEAIPVEARIITCCDSWNAMRTDRPYRKALTVDAALTELKANAGLQFDPRIVEALLGVLPATEPGVAIARLDFQTRPQVKLSPLGGASATA